MAPFNGIQQLAAYDAARGGYIVHDEVDVFIAKKLHTCSDDLEAVYASTYEKLSRYDAPNEDGHEAPILGQPPPTPMPDEQDSFCAITSTVNGVGPYIGAMRDKDWLITARHGILADGALSQYSTSMYVKKGSGKPVRIHVTDSVIAPESLKIKALEAFGCSGHDLIAFKVSQADTGAWLHYVGIRTPQNLRLMI